MAHESEVHAKRWVDVFVDGVLEFVALHRSQKGLRLGQAASSCSLLLRLLLLFLSYQTLVLAQGPIVKRDKALGFLEEVLIRLVRSKLDVEIHLRVCLNLGVGWPHSEWIEHPFLCRDVHHLKQGPVDID